MRSHPAYDLIHHYLLLAYPTSIQLTSYQSEAVVTDFRFAESYSTYQLLAFPLFSRNLTCYWVQPMFHFLSL